MGRKKFDKTKAVTFRLQYRSADDPAYSEGGLLSDRIFAVVDPVKSKEHKADPQLKERILSRFTDRDLGIIDEKAARKIKKEKLLKQKEDQERGVFSDLPPEIASKIKDRDDLWITHLNRMKVDQELQEIEEEEMLEREAEKALKKKASKGKAGEDDFAEVNNEEDEEWEDDDGDEDEDGEWEEDDDEEEGGDHEDLEDEEFEEEEYKDNELEDAGEEEFEVEEIEVDEEELKAMMEGDEAPQLIDASKAIEISSKVKEMQVSKSKKEKSKINPDEEIDLKNVKLAPGVKTKRYDENGLPLDGYNYYQHIADPSKGGAPDFVFVAEYKETRKIAKDIDINVEELTPEQREVYEALEFEGEGAYEELEDDFLDMITGGEAVILESESKTTKAVPEKKDEMTMEISYDKSEVKKTDKTAKNVKFSEGEKKERKIQLSGKPSSELSVQSKKDLARAFREKVEDLRRKFIETGTIGGKVIKQKPPTQQYQEEDESEEEVEELDENDPDMPIDKLTEEGRIDFRQDVAMQAVLNKESTDDDSPDEAEDEDKDEIETIASRSFYQGPTPALTIIKEDNAKKSKKHQKNDNESKQSEQADDKKEADSDESEDEAHNESVVSDVFTKRRKGETKEEKKARKQMIKEFKAERRHKKAEFKTIFDNEKKKNLEKFEKIAGASNPRGVSVYKL
eukprot:CAMPEP_0176445708 /NCGR_PEP_ID=MMETSP0127-20121128/23874_1 /TAXON_ID=938130 /ORGANISM="Platyophrya macrostoma, Strain WH" /LENGTH=681 /DNA_ID=CAMNT_0017831569 /DNA_START=30 /DNA_END=2078 /DNA_ORIENTATION=-